MKNPFMIADGVYGNITSYQIYLNQTLEATPPINSFTCDTENVCNYTVATDNFSSFCISLAYIPVALSASNRLGKGPSTNSINIGI